MFAWLLTIAPQPKTLRLFVLQSWDAWLDCAHSGGMVWDLLGRHISSTEQAQFPETLAHTFGQLRVPAKKSQQKQCMSIFGGIALILTKVFM